MLIMFYCYCLILYLWQIELALNVDANFNIGAHPFLNDLISNAHILEAERKMKLYSLHSCLYPLDRELICVINSFESCGYKVVTQSEGKNNEGTRLLCVTMHKQ